MKNKLFLRLCLILMVALTISSCRTDYLQENETFNNSSKFQLTSKRISLNESKHREKLIPELTQVEAEFKAKAKSNVQCKLVSYGNGVSIDTEDVVFIEYGSYHTYTFKINRENAPADAPVENLILSLEPDGTYKELLKTYTLTPNDWHELSLGNGIDFEGKTTTVELTKGTYYNPSLAKGTGSGCRYESQQVYQACCHGVHGEGNIGDWSQCTCTGSGLPQMYTLEILVCDTETGAPSSGWNPSLPIPTAPTGGGEPLDGGSNSGTETNPTNPHPVEGAQGQLGGTPTLPILGALETEDQKTDCERLKEKTDDAAFKHKMDSLKLRVTQVNPDKHETSITIEKYKGKISYSIAQSSTSFQADGTKKVENIQSNYDIAGIHNHCPGGIPIFSYPDMVSFYDHYKNLVPFRKNEFSMFLVTFKGTSYALRMQDISALDTLFNGMDLATKEGRALAEKIVKEIYETVGNLNTNQNYTIEMAEKMLMKVLNSKYFGNGNSVFLYQQDGSQWKKLILNPDGAIQKIPCPQP